MRYYYFLVSLLVLTCGKSQNFHDVNVNFQQKSFLQILDQAQTSQTKLLVDFWADG